MKMPPTIVLWYFLTIPPLISQYDAQHYLQKDSTTLASVQDITVHKQSQNTTPVHNSPIHTLSGHTSPVHNSPVHNSQLAVQDSQVDQSNEEIQKSSTPTPSPLYDTSAPPLDMHLSPADTPKGPPFQDLLFSGVDIQSPICSDPITPTQPTYDSSVGPTSRRTCMFPLPPRPCSLESSPTKSPTSISGFALHAAGVNAFSATSTSHSRVSEPTIHVVEAQPSDNTDDVEISDCEGTPQRRRPPYIPCMEENNVAKELYKCKEIPAPTLICPLPQIKCDLFYKSVSKFGEA
ncbi:unnamed protein product [Eruca vesicaria subsp. sativa]|uniref:Uncharacterized protein n=1 Tax=Eruca vesicaria subsp. sativa TaxID=29727 RepID=A0ABC8L9B3_ERUVS|nr:unnamed protein product [Eruca vesicaria subsp. sativa]